MTKAPYHVNVADGEQFESKHIAIHESILGDKANYPEYFGSDTPAGAKFVDVRIVNINDVDNNNKYLQQAVRSKDNPMQDAISDDILNHMYDLRLTPVQVMLKSDGDYAYWTLEGRTRMTIFKSMGVQYVLVYVYEEMDSSSAIEYAIRRNDEKKPAGKADKEDYRTTITSLMHNGTYTDMSVSQIKKSVAGTLMNAPRTFINEMVNMVLENAGTRVAPVSFNDRDEAVDYIDDNIALPEDAIFVPVTSNWKTMMNDIIKAMQEHPGKEVRPVIYTQKWKNIDTEKEFISRNFNEVTKFNQSLSDIKQYFDRVDAMPIYVMPQVHDMGYDMDKLIKVK